MRFQGFVGPAYTLKSVNVDCQRCVNLFPEVIESGSGKEAQVAYLKSTPGLEKLMNIGSGPIRMILRVPTPYQDYPLVGFPEILYLVVSGNKVYKVTYSSGVWTSTVLNQPSSAAFTMDTSSGPVIGRAKTGLTVIPANPPTQPSPITVPYGMAYFADGKKLYLFIIDATNLNGAVDSIVGPKPSHVDFVDGYFIINEVGTGTFYATDWGSISFVPKNFANSEGDIDNLVAILVINRYVYLLNEKSTEVWVNTGNADFPFERISGGFIEKGCVAPYSATKIDGTAFWLGRDDSGQGVVYAAQGLTPQRISTHAIEQAIAGYADIKSATAYTYQSEGHSFYVLNFDEATWVYDLSTKLWHERAFTYEGNLQRHRGNVHAFFPELGAHLIGDYSNNKIYKFNSEYFTDDGEAITRMRTAPHVSGGFKRLFCSSFQLDMETGVGLDGGGLGSDPKVMMDFSDDGGHTWSNESWVSAGKKIGGIGQFKTRVIWRRLGSFFDRVFRIKITDPVKVVILGADIEVSGGR